MESLKTKQLFEAASTGRVDSLKTLLDEDPLILDKISADYDISDTPLHVAAMLGHADFAKEIIRLRPQLTGDLNARQLSSPLHLASAKGHVDIARALLEANPQLSLICDRNGLAPVHLAAVKGQIEVLKVLLRAEPAAARLVVYRGGENILHLCVKYFRSEALKLVVNTIGEPKELLNAKDADGNTVLHLAVADKQIEVVNFLLSLSEVVEVNATNLNGMTAVDVLIGSRSDVRDSEIETSLRNAGGLCAECVPPRSSLDRVPDKIVNQKNKSIRNEQWIDSQKSALMVVASLIATMAFQIGVNPPSGVWQEDGPPVENSTTRTPYYAGHSIYAGNYETSYVIFNIVNTIGFTASLSIILLLMSGLPLRIRFFMWILMVITWVAILALGAVYALAVFTIAPPSTKAETIVFNAVLITMVVWAALMLLLVSHTIRLSTSGAPDAGRSKLSQCLSFGFLLVTTVGVVCVVFLFL